MNIMTIKLANCNNLVITIMFAYLKAAIYMMQSLQIVSKIIARPCFQMWHSLFPYAHVAH
jgi:hypothetical protein